MRERTDASTAADARSDELERVARSDRALVHTERRLGLRARDVELSQNARPMTLGLPSADARRKCRTVSRSRRYRGRGPRGVRQQRLPVGGRLTP
jgi:hypothetical protein